MVKSVSEYTKIFPKPDYIEVRARPQVEWRWLISIAFYSGGLGVGTYIFSLFYKFTAGMIIGYVIAALLMNAALFFDAGKGFRVWRAVKNFKTSWISRGIVFISFFSIFGFLSIIGHLNLLGPFSVGSPLVMTMEILAVIFGLGVMFYSGFVMSFSTSLPFWNNALVPMIFLIYSFLGGLSLLLAVSPFFPAHGMDIDLMEKLELMLILLTLFSILVYVVNSLESGQTPRLSVTKWLKNPAFWLGIIVVGLLLPFFLGIWAFFRVADLNMGAVYLSIAGFMELVGGFIFRFILLDVGYFAPLLNKERKIR